MHGYGYGSMWPMGATMFGWLLLTVLIVGLVVWLVVSYGRAPGSVTDTGAARRSSPSGTPAAS